MARIPGSVGASSPPRGEALGEPSAASLAPARRQSGGGKIRPSPLPPAPRWRPTAPPPRGRLKDRSLGFERRPRIEQCSSLFERPPAERPTRQGGGGPESDESMRTIRSLGPAPVRALAAAGRDDRGGR